MLKKIILEIMKIVKHMFVIMKGSEQSSMKCQFMSELTLDFLDRDGLFCVDEGSSFQLQSVWSIPQVSWVAPPSHL